MKAIWDWHMPRARPEDEEALVAFAHETGFDTLILHEPTPVVMDAAHARGMRVCAIVTPTVSAPFAQAHADALQAMLPAEDAIAAAVQALDWETYTVHAHRWFPLVQMSPLLCYESPTAQEELKRRVAQALTLADGVAFDGFGFRNHYACHCTFCQALRDERAAAQPDQHPAAILAETSEASLLQIAEILYAHARACKPDALVTNHVWPPFRPNPDYASGLHLDFCSQTISWFYRPHWSLERVAFEARRMKALERPACNRFAPFIGMFDAPHLVRSPERLAAELDIALEHGAGHLVFCSLRTLWRWPALRQVVQAALTS